MVVQNLSGKGDAWNREFVVVEAGLPAVVLRPDVMREECQWCAGVEVPQLGA